MPKYKIDIKEQFKVHKGEGNRDLLASDEERKVKDKRAKDAGLPETTHAKGFYDDRELDVAESHKKAMDRIKEDRIIKNNRGNGTRPWDK